MLESAIPVVHVSSSRRAEAFYVEKLGFTLTSAMRPFGGDDPCYMGLGRDGAYLHMSSFPGDGVSGTAVMFRTEDVDALYQEFLGRGVAIDLEPTNQSWENREMYLADPDGNSLRFFMPMGG